MILEAILTWFRDLAVWLLGLLPEWEPPDVSGWATAAVPMWAFARWLNNYVPVDLTLGFLATLLVIWLSLFVYRATIYVLTKLHLLGGSDT